MRLGKGKRGRIKSETTKRAGQKGGRRQKRGKDDSLAPMPL
jgi:hypothetical protein